MIVTKRFNQPFSDERRILGEEAVAKPVHGPSHKIGGEIAENQTSNQEDGIVL